MNANTSPNFFSFQSDSMYAILMYVSIYNVFKTFNIVQTDLID